MQFDLPATHEPVPGQGEDIVHRLEAAPSSLPADEDTRAGYAGQATSPLESEGLVRTLFERVDICIALVSLQGRWLRFNQRLCDLLGYTAEELAARTWQDVTFPDDRGADLEASRRLRAGELDAYDIDSRYVRQDGTPVWVHLTASLVRNTRGEPYYVIATVEDISARKRLEQDRTQLLEQERAARAEAEATNKQLSALQALTDTALSHLALDDLLRELLGRLVAVMGVDGVSLLLLDEDSHTLTVRAARGPGEAGLGQTRVSVGQGFSGRIAASREPMIVNDTSTFEGMHPILRDSLRSAVGVPLLVEDQVEDHLESRLLGVVNVGSAAPRRFTEADVQLLQRAADRIALAVGRALLYAAEQDARQQAEAALSRAVVSETQATDRAQRLHTILETMADGVVVYDAEGRAIQMNRAYLELQALDRGPAGFANISAFDRASILHLRDASTGEQLPAERIPSVRALRGEVVAGPDGDLRMRAFDGRELEVNASAVPMRDPDGRIIGGVVVLRDMTERNRLAREHEEARASELAAREVSRRMEEFLATAAHDLRSPLTATLGYIALAERQSERLASAARDTAPALAAQVEEVHHREEDAHRSALRLTRLLTLLFDTAAIRADKLELHRAPCDLAAPVSEHVAALRVAAPDRTITLHTPADGKPIPVEADADRIGQVVTNYVTNALKYSPPDRPVEVSVAARGSRALVTVRDQGPGIPKAERAQVWELFHRAPGVEGQGSVQDTSQGGSLGLGLYICKAIVTAHGGRVGVKSAVGEGSTFWFTLPLTGPMSGLAGTAP